MNEVKQYYKLTYNIILKILLIKLRYVTVAVHVEYG